MRYFQCQNAGRIWGGVRFTRYEIVGGSSWGVAELEDNAPELEAVSNLAADPKQPVTEITKAEYDACLKKKPPGLEDWQPRQVAAPERPVTGPSIKLPTAVVVDTPPAAEEGKEAPVEVGAPVEADAALATGPVDAPPAPEPVAQTKKQKAANWDSKRKT